MSKTVKLALIKLTLSIAVLAVLVFTCFLNIDRSLISILIALTVLLVVPAVILSCVDASRAIKRERSTKNILRALGHILGIPQIFLGASLVVIGVVYPFFGIREIFTDILSGQPTIVPFIFTGIAFLMLLLGYYYLREGLNLVRTKKRN